ncbi:Uncharacterised protein [Enterobacter roggenkampii]|nr:Uncharacterised protein [Enterobacter roggenkampii]
MLLAALILHPQLVVRRGAQHVAGVVVAGDRVRMFRIVQGICDIRQVNITVAVRYRHFGPVGERCVPPQRVSGIRLCHPQPQVAVPGFRPFPVEVGLHPVAPLFVKVSVNIVLFPALNAGRKRTVNFRTRDVRRAETVTLGVGHAPHRHVQAGITGSPEGHKREDNPLFQGRNDIALWLQHLPGREVGSIAEQVDAG